MNRKIKSAKQFYFGGRSLDAERLKLVYQNAIRTARPWYRKKYGLLPEKASLKFFEDLLGFYVPDRFGLGLVGESLRLIRGQIKEGRNCADLTSAAKDGWTSIIRHNKLDLEGMAFVCGKMEPLDV